MKKILLRIGTGLLVLTFIVAAIVLARLGLATVQVARAAKPVSWQGGNVVGSTTSLTILPLYEEAASGEEYVSGHGVSYLVRTDEASLLMDLGNNPEQAEMAPVVVNMETAGISPGEADLLFISHKHPDHLGGLQWRPASFYTGDGHSLLDVDAVYVAVDQALPDVPAHVAKAPQHVAEAPQIIAPGVATLGRMPFVQPFPFWLWEPLGYEQVLAVNVEGKGVVLITGCGHPTLEKIVARAESVFDEPVTGIVGGLHYEGLSTTELQPHVDFLAARDPQLVALSPHDNGPQAIAAFHKALPAAYRYIRVGEEIYFGAPAVAGTNR